MGIAAFITTLLEIAPGSIFDASSDVEVVATAIICGVCITS